ncbi:hypothetical protein SAMN06265353_1318 [Hydrogenobacter hydrogenophilus]|uniref:Uncharacterized protein n=1 Tax=Hydrogenobacter hydrogenophilus TaxID=35835 RepID=A0A285P0D2_9AQUI|nr:hypothetical protein SAMN06265353_1318 [Hydrogenobacter hydrogenophilus]
MARRLVNKEMHEYVSKSTVQKKQMQKFLRLVEDTPSEY